MKKIVEPLDKVLGTRSLLEYSSRWNPQILVEIDIAPDLPQVIDIHVGGDNILRQPMEFKHLPNSCFNLPSPLPQPTMDLSKLEEGSPQQPPFVVP